MTDQIPGPTGSLEAIIDEPAGQPRAAVVFAHPHPLHGGTMHTKAVFRGAKALARIGCVVLRFNFRGVGRSAGVHDGGLGEREDFTAGIDYVAKRYPGLPIWAAGFSFGSWIALTVGAEDPRVSAIIGIAPPLDLYDFSAVASSTKPKFFIQGERDEICPLSSMQRFYAHLPEPKELVVIDAANHLFEGKTLELGDAVEDLLGDWIPDYRTKPREVRT